jgi:hypothetical protein
MENKTGKYFKYAIGEIILVVIGILIALQINNWNENRKIQIIHEKYYVLLKKEALNNLANAKSAKAEIFKRMEAQAQIVKLIDTKLDTISEKNLSNLFANVLFGFTRYQFENTVISEFKSSGELKNIQNDSIRNKLVKLEPLISSLRSQEANVKSDYESTREIMVSDGSTRTVIDDFGWNIAINTNEAPNKTSNKTVLKLKTFENRLLDYMGTTWNIYNSHYPRIEKHLNELVILIDEELENFKK